MTGTTFSGTYVSGIYLNNYATENPATIAATGNVSNTGIGLSAQTGHAWTITNYGTVTGNGTNGIGVFLPSGGSLNNQQTGLIKRQ